MSTKLTVTRGDDITLDISAVEDGEPVDLTGVDVWWTAKHRHSDLDEDAVIQKTVGDGVTITDGPGGVATVDLVPADTAGLTSGLWWDLQIKDGEGKIRTLAGGRLVVTADVTGATA